MGLFSSVVDSLLTRITRHLPLRTISHEGDPYLHRFYVCGRLPTRYFPGAKPLLGWMSRIVYLHCFVRPDRDREPHNHPFDDSWSFILTGGYVEERVVAGVDEADASKIKTEHRFYYPGDVNRIGQNDFHRVSRLMAPRVWTLFIAGRKVDTWYFLDLATGKKIPWWIFHKMERPDDEG